jgi:hypothetical protein
MAPTLVFDRQGFTRCSARRGQPDPQLRLPGLDRPPGRADGRGGGGRSSPGGQPQRATGGGAGAAGAGGRPSRPAATGCARWR